MSVRSCGFTSLRVLLSPWVASGCWKAEGNRIPARRWQGEGCAAGWNKDTQALSSCRRHLLRCRGRANEAVQELGVVRQFDLVRWRPRCCSAQIPRQWRWDAFVRPSSLVVFPFRLRQPRWTGSLRSRGGTGSPADERFHRSKSRFLVVAVIKASVTTAIGGTVAAVELLPSLLRPPDGVGKGDQGEGGGNFAGGYLCACLCTFFYLQGLFCKCCLYCLP